MHLRVVNNTVVAEQYSAEEYRWLDENTTYGCDRWSVREKRIVTQALHLLKGKKPTFPAGLLRMVTAQAEVDDVQLNVIDQPQLLAVDTTADIGWLDDTQKKAFNRALVKRNGILKLATGSGKTEIAVALMYAHKCNCLFLVHKTNLLHQTADRFFKRTGERAGIIGDSVFVPGRVTIATYQTLTKMLLGARRKETLAFLESIGIVVADECHVVPSNTAYTIVMACKKAELRIGLSATPLERSDQRSIYAIAALGPIMFKVNAAHSISTGRLVAPTIRMVRCVHPSNRGGWQFVYRKFVLENDARNALIAHAVKLAAKPCFVFVKQLQQGAMLLKTIRRAGINAEFVNGSHNTEQRKAAIKKLVRHDIDVIVTTPVFQEGVDVPSLASVVMAGGGASHIAALQSIGRALRANDGKTSAEVWDIMDLGINSLQKHAEARATAYRNEGHKVLVGSFEQGFKEVK